jgi:hypothetical protein
VVIRDQVMATVALMVAEPDAEEDAFLPRLAAAGCSPLQALLLTLLVPLALGRAALARWPGMPATMPEAAGILAADRVYYVRLTAIPEFSVAAEMAASGAISFDHVAAVGARGSELHAIQAAVEAGQDLTQSQMSAPLLLGLADAPGFVVWIMGFGPQDCEVELTPSTPPPKPPWWRFW